MPAFTDDQLANIQGLGIAGFRKDRQRFLFVRFRDAATGTALLKAVTDQVATAWEVGQFNVLCSALRRRSSEDPPVKATWIGLLLSSAGYAKLGVNLDTELPASEGSVAFKEGMAARATFIGDTRAKDAPAQWKPEFRPPARIDAVFVVAADDPEDLDKATLRLSDSAQDPGCRPVPDFPGAAPARPGNAGNRDGSADAQGGPGPISLGRRNHAESRLRPDLRRLAMTLRPPTVAIRDRKPCRRLRTSLLAAGK